MTARTPIVTAPAARGRPSTTTSTAADTAATSAQPGATRRPAATTHAAAATRRRRRASAGSPTAKRGGTVTGAGSRRRSRSASTMHASTVNTVRARAIVSGRCAVQRIATSTGPSLGGTHQPLNPPSTSCGAPRSPAAVDADQDSWKPSPRTSQHPSRQPSTVTSRCRRPCPVTVAVGAAGASRRTPDVRTTRSTSRPVRAPGVDAMRWVPASSTSCSSPQTLAPSGAPASASASVPVTRTGSGVPSTLSRSSRQPVSMRSGTVARGPIESSLIAAGCSTGSP